MKSIQKTITAADAMLDQYKIYRRIQLTYFADQTAHNLAELRYAGKMLEHLAGVYEKERNEK